MHIYHINHVTWNPNLMKNIWMLRLAFEKQLEIMDLVYKGFIDSNNQWTDVH